MATVNTHDGGIDIVAHNPCIWRIAMNTQQIRTMLHSLAFTEKVTWVEAYTLSECIGDISFSKCTPFPVII